MVNVAIVGLGYWGPNLLRNVASLEDVRIVALCDLDLQRADASRRRFCPDARLIDDYRMLGDQSDVKAVVIAMQIQTHYELGSFFLGAGRHVLMEKPLARTALECQSLIALAARNRRVLMVGHVFEYNVAAQRIKRYIEDGELGTLFYLYSQRVNLGRIQHDVNPMWSFAPHDISIMNYWFGQEPLWVSARGFSYLGSKIEDVVFLTLEYPSGIGAHLHLGWLDPRKVRLMTLVGSKKMVVYDDVSLHAKIQLYDKGITDLDDFLKAPETFAEFQFRLRQGDVVIPTLQFSEPLQNECSHFIDCIKNCKQPATDGLSGLRVVRVLEAAEQSLKLNGKQIELPGRLSITA